MSELKVEALKVVSIEKHPNADKLDCIQLLDWNVIVLKDSFCVGDLGVYFPIDSILPKELEDALFPPDGKIKLSKSRIRTIKLRGCISQGLFVNPENLGLKDIVEGQDLTAMLGVTKFEPPEESLPEYMRSEQKKKKKKKDNPNLCKYTDIDHLKKYPGVLQDGEIVYISEKIHGTSVRVGIVPMVATSWFDKTKKIIGLLPQWQRVWGSKNVQLQNRFVRAGFYKEDIYTKIVKQYNLMDKIEPNTIIFGEIYGCGIQSGYTYGCTNREVKFVAYDVMQNGKYLDYGHFAFYCNVRGIPRVPTLFVGKYDRDFIQGYAEGPSTLCSEQKIREGVVIKPIKERSGHCGRVVLKLLNEDYLLKEQTEFH